MANIHTHSGGPDVSSRPISLAWQRPRARASPHRHARLRTGCVRARVVVFYAFCGELASTGASWVPGGGAQGQRREAAGHHVPDVGDTGRQATKWHNLGLLV